MFRVVLTVAAIAVAAAFGADNAAAQAAPQAPEGRLKTILSTKKIKIAHRVDSLPFSFVRNGQVTGYTIDICKAVVASIERQFKVTGIEMQWVPVTSQSRFDVIAAGEADMECGASTVTLSRMKIVDFSNFVFVETTGVVTTAKSGINSANDLANKRVAVVSGTTNEQALVRRSQQIPMNLVRVKERAEGIAMLEAGKVDAYASDKLLLLGIQWKDPKAMRLLGDDLSIEPYAIALPRGDWALRLAVNTALAGVFSGSEIAFIFQSWFGPIGLKPGPLLSASFLLNALPE
jgi:glutamate/aspartate transport system substrate-binding protein